MISQFKYKDIDSSTYGVYFRSVVRPLLPQIRTKSININGTSGSYDFGDNEYANIQVRIRIVYIPTNYIERKQKAREIAAWLSSNIWQKLILGDEPDKYYLARVYGQVDLDPLMASGEAEVAFECQPFSYSVEESSFSFSTAAATNYSFENLGTRKISYKSPQGSIFIITINGSWTTVSISLNGNALNYTEAVVSGELVIDNIEMEAALGGINKFNALDGDIDTFLSVIPGENVLSVSGTNLNIDVTIDFIPMWL